MEIYKTQIARILKESAQIRTYLLERPAAFSWQEGARVHLALPGYEPGQKERNRNRVRHMSIATMPSEDTVGITTRLPEPSSEFKQALGQLEVGAPMTLFKVSSHVPLERDGRAIYLLSQGVGLATFRSHVLEYLRDPSGIPSLHSLTVARPDEVLYPDVFRSRGEQRFTAHYVHHRDAFHDAVQALAADTQGLFYLVGSDAFLLQTVQQLLSHGVPASQIRLDKNPHELPQFFGAAPGESLPAVPSRAAV